MFIMLALLGCDNTPLEPTPTEIQRRTCVSIYTQGNRVGVHEVDLLTGEQGRAGSLYELPALNSFGSLRTNGLGLIGDRLISLLTVDGDYLLATLDQESNQAELAQGLLGREAGGHDEVLVQCPLSDQLCIYPEADNVPAGPIARITGPVGSRFQSDGDRIYGMEQQGGVVGVWDRDGTWIADLELEDYTGWNRGFAVVGDRLVLLEDGLFAEPFSEHELLRVFDLETGSQIDSFTIETPGGASQGLHGLSCSEE